MKDNIPFEQKRTLALSEAEKRCAQVWERCPEIKEIDTALSNTGLLVFRASMLPDGEREREIENLSKKSFELQERKKELLLKLGFDENYTKPRFECEKCSDTGYIGHKICTCYKKYLSEKRIKESGLSRYLGSQSFETFRLDLYPETMGKSHVRENMKDTLEFCKSYAKGFDGESGESLLFVGGTGLGKTHLSSAIAQVVIEKGFSVVYDSAQNILATFERDRFSQSEKKPSDKYFEADLLIIDDLGTEIKGASALSYFYTLINTRLVAMKSCIISTNLSPENLRRQYEERFVSRLFGEYAVFLFEGEDIRKTGK